MLVKLMVSANLLLVNKIQGVNWHLQSWKLRSRGQPTNNKNYLTAAACIC